MVPCAPFLEVGEQHLWIDVSLKSLRVSEFLHPHLCDDGENKLRSLLPLRLVSAAVVSLVLVRCFRARMDNVYGIIIVVYTATGRMRLMRLCVPPVLSYEIWRSSGATTSRICLRLVSDSWPSIGSSCSSALENFVMISLGAMVSGVCGFGSGTTLFSVKCRRSWR